MDKIQNSTAYGVLNNKYAYGTPEGMNRVTKETMEYFGRKWLISFFNGEICLHRQFNSWEFPNSVDTRKVL